MGNTGISQLGQSQDNLVRHSTSKSDLFHANRNNLLTIQELFLPSKRHWLKP